MKSLILDLINVSEATAIALYEHIGKNNPMAADAAAVAAMRQGLNSIDFKAKIVIGEGERDKAPMLHIGEVVGCGRGNIEYDIAVDPLECTNRCAVNSGGSMTALVIAEAGMLLPAPDIYMNKIAALKGEIDLDDSTAKNLAAVSTARDIPVRELVVAILDRQRNQQIISEVLDAGAKVKLIADGDIAAAMMACMQGSGIDVYMGIGGAPEGVIAAAAISMMGGKMQGKLIFENQAQKDRATLMLHEPDRKFSADNMVGIRNKGGELFFVITAVTAGELVGCNSGLHSMYIHRDCKGRVLKRQIITASNRFL